MNARLRFVAAIAALLGVTAGCTTPQRDADVATGSPTQTSTTTTLPTPGGEVPTLAGRLAVLDDAGTLFTVAPDGSDTLVLAEAVEGRAFVRQPAWSPDGDRLAWVQLDTSEGSLAASVVTVRSDGSERTEAPTEVAPFYLSWDPTSSRVAYLGSASSGIELGVVDVARGGRDAVPLDAGSPLYLSWHRSGERMLVHVGRDRLDTLDLDGTLTTVAPRPGDFNAPVWTSDGRSLVYATRSAGGQRLVVRDANGRGERELVRFDGVIRFVVDADGSRIAFQTIDASGGVGPLRVVDVGTGRIEDVADGATPAFFWSPDGDRLLYLFVEPDDERVWLRWGIWGGPAPILLPRFLPTPVFAREYLQFFDQYAQSMSLWAPDGSAFTYAAVGESGGVGVWVQPAEDGAEPVLVADGVFAAWSPA